MAEEVLVKEILSEKEIATGEELLKRLDDAKLEILAAYWIFNYEVGVWRLEFVSPQVESKGPLRFYAKVLRLLHDKPALTSQLGLGSINVSGTKYSFYKSLRATIQSKKKLTGVQLDRAIVGGQLVDLYLYRL